MSKEQNIVNYYVLCNRLKDVIRSGWGYFKVNRKRVESVAEHIYGVQMLAIAMKSEYEYDIDIMKVVYMLAIHELGETVVGDLIPYLKGNESKEKAEHDAVHGVLAPLMDSEQIEALFLEFDEHKTPESKFAHQCDKLEADIQCKLYDQEHCVDISKLEGIATFKKELLESDKSWSEMWIETTQEKQHYDENFMKISNYIKDNEIGIEDLNN